MKNKNCTSDFTFNTIPNNIRKASERVDSILLAPILFLLNHPLHPSIKGNFEKVSNSSHIHIYIWIFIQFIWNLYNKKIKEQCNHLKTKIRPRRKASTFSLLITSKEDKRNWSIPPVLRVKTNPRNLPKGVAYAASREATNNGENSVCCVHPLLLQISTFFVLNTRCFAKQYQRTKHILSVMKGNKYTSIVFLFWSFLEFLCSDQQQLLDRKTYSWNQHETKRKFQNIPLLT
jgi:hypothetical protein